MAVGSAFVFLFVFSFVVNHSCVNSLFDFVALSRMILSLDIVYFIIIILFLCDICVCFFKLASTWFFCHVLYSGEMPPWNSILFIFNPLCLFHEKEFILCTVLLFLLVLICIFLALRCKLQNIDRLSSLNDKKSMSKSIHNVSSGKFIPLVMKDDFTQNIAIVVFVLEQRSLNLSYIHK